MNRIWLAPLIVLFAAAPAFAIRTYGVDVSHWDGTINWTSVKNSGKVFAYTKATEGVTFNDDTFVANMVNGKAAGMLMGAYHFARPDNNTYQDEVTHFIQIIQPYLNTNYMRPVLDLETGPPGWTKQQLSDWGNNFIDDFEARTGIECVLYSGHNFSVNYVNSSLNKRDVWFANYPATPDPENGGPNLGPSFDHWEIWQYSSTGTVPGITGNVDLNVAKGDTNYVKSFMIPEPACMAFAVLPLLALRRRGR